MVSFSLSRLTAPSLPLPKQSYAITRQYPWKYFHQLLYGGTVLAFGFIVAVAFATQGYEPKPVLLSDYNATQHHWFNHFSPKPKPGTLCDPHVFSLGDSFQTSHSTFSWMLDYILLRATTTDHGISYSGESLTGRCNVTQVEVWADLQSWTTEVTVTIGCDPSSGFPVSATTSFIASPYLQKTTIGSNRFIRTSDATVALTSNVNALTSAAVLEFAGIDVLNTLRIQNAASQATSFGAVLHPNSSTGAACYVRQFTPFINMVGFNNATLSNDPAAVRLFVSTFWNVTSNYMQTMLAAANFDIGSLCASFLTDPSLINSMLYKTPALENKAADAYVQGGLPASFLEVLNLDPAQQIEEYTITLPLQSDGDVLVLAAYLCHLSRRKGAAQLFIAVVVATSSLTLTSWTVVMCVAKWFVMREPEANFCSGHASHPPNSVGRAMASEDPESGSRVPSTTTAKLRLATPRSLEPTNPTASKSNGSTFDTVEKVPH
ncbi:hypothetical protein FRB95_003404 [Tulasnella sp. JGI-2019a]|nr:hypothetical protein FRB95_003404 [Tulasnella sp. JGI-2019a]